MNILLIGAGRTGRAIAENLLELKRIKNLFVFSRTSKSSKALAYDLDSKKIKVVDDIKKLKNIDYVVVALSGVSDSARQESINKRNSTYEVRQDELRFNIGAITHIIDDLETLDKDTIIIVVTNPVDEITNYLRIMLKRNNILGFGLGLDASRYEKILNKKVLCIGTHGKAIPLINSKSEIDYDRLLNENDSALLKYIREHGIPNKFAGSNFKDFFEKLTGKSKEIIHVSSYLKEDFYGVNNISISLPYEVSKGDILNIADITLNDIEKGRFIASANELRNSVNQILEAHKKLLEYK